MPTQNSDMSDNPDTYIGIYTGSAETAPTSYQSYNWNKIVGSVNVEADMVVIDITLSAENWSESAPYSQTVEDSALKANMYPFVDIAFSNDNTQWGNELTQYSYITRCVCNTGSITFYCKDTKPTEDINLKVRLNGDVNASSFVTQDEFDDLKSSIGDLNTALENILAGGI